MMELIMITFRFFFSAIYIRNYFSRSTPGRQIENSPVDLKVVARASRNELLFVK